MKKNPRANKAQIKSVLVNWLAIYPTITIVLYVSEPLLAGLVLPVKTFLLTAALVPIMMFVAVPLVKKMLSADDQDSTINDDDIQI